MENALFQNVHKRDEKIIEQMHSYIYKDSPALICIFFSFAGIIRRLDVGIKKEYESTGKLIEYTLSVSNKDIKYISETGTDFTIGFEKIKTVFISKNTIMLASYASTLYVFPKSTFTVGSAEEFVEFLKEKCIPLGNGKL